MSEERNTTLAFVKLSPSGERDFCFYRKNTADYCHSLSTAEELMRSADIVHIGSLALSEDIGAEFCLSAAENAQKLGKKISFDVNYREDIFKKDFSRFNKMIEKADIVKVSEDELFMLAGKKDIPSALSLLAENNKLVAVTLGEKGSAAYYNGSYYCEKSIKIKPVDTTGAGDAFYAGFLASLDGKDFSAQNISYALKFGNVCGALTCTGYGAIDPLPDYETILSKFNC